MSECVHAASHSGFVLLGKSLEDLEALALSNGQPRYRGKQLLDGVLNGAHTLDDIKTVRHTERGSWSHCT